jgi:FtsH-binding integral membrane protein
MSESYSAAGLGRPVSEVAVETRATFIARTYFHLLGAIMAFTLIEVWLFQSGLAVSITRSLGGVNWLLVLGAFVVVSWLASRVAHSALSLPAQYAALAVFVAAEAIIFAPLLLVAELKVPGVIGSAAWVTLLGFGALTFVAFVSRTDFSFLRGVLLWGGICALGLIIASAAFGANLGTWFALGMIAFAGAAVLYDTSNIIHHYPEDRYVAAALELFASIALMFWYVLRFLSSRRD